MERKGDREREIERGRERVQRGPKSWMGGPGPMGPAHDAGSACSPPQDLNGSSGLRRKGVVGKEGTNVHGKLQPILSVSVMYGTHPLDVLASWTLLQKSFSVSLFEGLIPS
ncbi:hypothetical protein NQZ68_015635 [Dissostichus eleginoides]|nr:hypothetical protein NQZ68_015635 [Dissostichus eleginoides]